MGEPAMLKCFDCGKASPMADGPLCAECAHKAAHMTTCADCGQEISKRAPTCIHCGAPTGVIDHTASPQLTKQEVSQSVFTGGIRVALFVIGALLLLASIVRLAS